MKTELQTMRNGLRKSRVRVIYGDPATSEDYFGFCGGEILPQKREIHVMMATQWNHLSFRDSAIRMKPVYKAIRPDVFALEKNNRGKEAILEFRNQGIPVMPVTTTGNVKDRTRWDVMDKVYTVDWIVEAMKYHLIKFPAVMSRHMHILLDQIALVAKSHSPSGNTRYAARTGHDDIFSGFVGFCHFGRLYLS